LRAMLLCLLSRLSGLLKFTKRWGWGGAYFTLTTVPVRKALATEV
jgi:hypothetical protein